MNLPFLPENKTHRAFEISGESMLPIPAKSIVIGEYIEDLTKIKNGDQCVVVTKEDGIVFKRVYNFLKESHGLLLVSDNYKFEPYFIHFSEVIEVWRKIKIIIDKIESTQIVAENELVNFALRIKNEL